ncbi:MAG: 3-oxoacyl-[acyl-carrier-protein] reductase [Acidobacteriota bacterium]
MGLLSEKIAVVTGASRGIGRAISEKLAGAGATVICADVMDCGETVESITGAGGKAEGLILNVTDGEAAEAVIRDVTERHGRIDILVNNAGITRDQLMIRMKAEDWRQVLEINLDGVFNVTQPVAKVMMRQRSGSVVNIASVVGMMGNAGQCNYSASKAGLIGMTKSLARELGPRGVTVNAIAPGFIRTPMTEKLNDDQREALLKNISIQRLGEPEDIAEAVAFLAGPGASYITGTVVNVSGGLYM